MQKHGLKVIDFARKGNVVRFYLGEKDCNDYWGDDWDDAPYEHNAGTVYDEYVKDFYDMYVPYDCVVLEPCCGEFNSSYSKDDMKQEKVPCIVIYKPKKDEYQDDDFKDVLGSKDSIKIYFNNTIEDLQDINFDFNI